MEINKILSILDRIERYYNKRFTENDMGFTVNLELYSDKSGNVKIYTSNESYAKKTGLRFFDGIANLFSFSGFDEFADNFLEWVINSTGV